MTSHCAPPTLFSISAGHMPRPAEQPKSPQVHRPHARVARSGQLLGTSPGCARAQRHPPASAWVHLIGFRSPALTGPAGCVANVETHEVRRKTLGVPHRTGRMSGCVVHAGDPTTSGFIDATRL